MFQSPDERIVLLDLPPQAAADPELTTVFIGAVAAGAPGAAKDLLDYPARLGFTPEVAGDLTGLPLAFDGAESFAAAFPGDQSWLAMAVSDYFLAGGRRAVVIRVQVDPLAALDAYVAANPAPPPIMADFRPTRGLEVAMAVPQAGLVILPDLERLCFDQARKSLAQAPRPQRPPPQFRPLADWPAAPAPASSAGPAASVVQLTPRDVLGPVNAALAALRPDMQLLFSLPVGADETLTIGALAERAKTYLYGANFATLSARPGGPDAVALPHVQALAPMLVGSGGDAATPSGLVAGRIADMAETTGLWRSLYGLALIPGCAPLRSMENRTLGDLRQWGVTVLRAGVQGASIDGDYMAIPLGATAQATRRSAGNRRLMGWLVRQLRALGEQLIFENRDFEDGRVELILMDFFDELQKAGALAGSQLSDAVKITRASAAANVIAYDILVQTALALETIKLQFTPSGVTATTQAGP